MRYMKQQGMDVIMVSADGPELPVVLEREGCRHEIIHMTRKITPIQDLRSLWALYRLFKKERPDIVHSHTPKAGLLAMQAAKLAGVKIRVHTIAGLRFMTAKGTTRRILIAMEKLTGTAATHVWPNSFSLLDYIKRNKLVAPRKLEVIGLGSSNGIDLTRYSLAALKEDKLNEIKEKINYDASLLYFVCVGRIVHDKGIDELVKSFSAVNKKYPQTRLVLVGGLEDDLDPISDEARTIIKTNPAILSPGWSNAVEYYMHIAFALVHPSHREGFPNVLLQAGALDCPIICSAIEGNIDIVEHRKTGLLFQVKSEKDLQEKLETALTDTASLKQYAENLRRKIEENFDQPTVHKLLYQRYQQLLSARKSG
jgi:glycosyltransferase involved in cell wall biosynthesis